MIIKIVKILYSDILYIICNQYYLLYENLLFLESDDGKVDKDDEEEEVEEINDENEIEEREMDAVFRHDQVNQKRVGDLRRPISRSFLRVRRHS